jgi:GT2 family glycosyltransferase
MIAGRVIDSPALASRSGPAGLPIVVIPARNEEALLPRLLSALSRQTVLATLPKPLDVVLVLNNTDDRSGEAATLAAVRLPCISLTLENVHFPATQAHVGFARKLAMDLASASIDNDAGVILSTDADAVPNDNWIEANLRAIEAGADLVGGRIVGDREEEALLGPHFQRRAQSYARYADLCDELSSLIDPLDYDPWPRHHDHTGASLAVRNDVYRHVGGLDPLPFREDLGFVAKVQASGYRLCHPPDVEVMVSARTVGRASGGMADCLRTWIQAEKDGQPALVECPLSVERRLLLRRQIRNLDGRPPRSVVWQLSRLGLASEGHIGTNAQLRATFADDDPDAEGTVPAAQAIGQIEQMIARRWGIADAA